MSTTVDSPFGSMTSPDEAAKKDPFGTDIIQPEEDESSKKKVTREEFDALEKRLTELETVVRFAFTNK